MKLPAESVSEAHDSAHEAAAHDSGRTVHFTMASEPAMHSPLLRRRTDQAEQQSPVPDGVLSAYDEAECNERERKDTIVSLR